jgi:hypothetical protein
MKAKTTSCGAIGRFIESCRDFRPDGTVGEGYLSYWNGEVWVPCTCAPRDWYAEDDVCPHVRAKFFVYQTGSHLGKYEMAVEDGRLSLSFEGRRRSFTCGCAIFKAHPRGNWQLEKSDTPWVPLFSTDD